MSKLVGISGYDAALPAAYQVGAPLGPPRSVGCIDVPAWVQQPNGEWARSKGGCGCAGVGKVYDFKTGPTTMSVDVPLDVMAADFMQATRIERIATTVGLGILIIGGLYLIGNR